MLAIYKKDVRSAFAGMTGWVLCAFVVLAVGLYFAAVCLTAGYADFGYVLQNATFVFLVVVPLLTMRSVVEERRQKTDQLLLTSPASIASIVWGKYLALLTVYAVPMCIVGLCPLVMRLYGTVSMARSYACLLAFFLMGAAAIAIGLFMSSLTENQIIAAVCTFGALLILYLINGISGLLSTDSYTSAVAFSVLAAVACILVYMLIKNMVAATLLFCAAEAVLLAFTKWNPSVLEGSFARFLDALALFDRFSPFVNGIFDVAALAYFISVALLFVFLTCQSFEKRRWS